jgi:hypothetical protein
MATNVAGFNGAPQSVVAPYGPPPASAPTGSPGTFNFGNTGNPTPPMPPQGTNPYGSPTAPATTPSSNTFAMPTGAPTANPAGAPVATAGTVNTGKLGQTIGSGLAQPVSAFLNSEGGYNSPLTSQAVTATQEADQAAIALGMGNLETNLAESGISPNSSVAALEKSNYMSNAVTQENAQAAQQFFQMWSQSQAAETSMLESLVNPSASHQKDTSFMSRLSQGIADFTAFF